MKSLTQTILAAVGGFAVFALTLSVLFVAAPPAANAQTVQEAKDYIRKNCTDSVRPVTVQSGKVVRTYPRGQDMMRLNKIAAIGFHGRDEHGYGYDFMTLSCPKEKGSFTVGEREQCVVSSVFGRYRYLTIDGGGEYNSCNNLRGVAKAIAFLVKRVNPDVEVDADIYKE